MAVSSRTWEAAPLARNRMGNKEAMGRLFMLLGILFAISTLIAACAKDGKQTVQTDNHNFSVTMLFEVDGCKVYRFNDAGNFLYFANCQGSVQYKDKHGTYHINTEFIRDTTDKLK